MILPLLNYETILIWFIADEANLLTNHILFDGTKWKNCNLNKKRCLAIVYWYLTNVLIIKEFFCGIEWGRLFIED